MRKHYLFFTAICLLITNFIHAQHFEWAKKGSGGGIYTYGIASDTSGNVYNSGWFSGTVTFGTFTLTSAGASDIYLVKYNSSGVIQWAKSAGGTGDDYGFDVEVDANGDVLISGYFNGSDATFDLTTINAFSDGNIFVAKYNNAGTMQWAKGYAKGTGGSCYKMSVDQYGNSFITGGVGPSAKFDSDSTGTNGAFTAKLDVSGNVVWVTGTEGGSGTAIASDSLGNVFTIGEFYSDTIFFGGSYLLNTGTLPSHDCFLVKYNSVGIFQWARAIGGPGNEYFKGADADSAGNVYLTGAVTDVTDFGNGHVITPYGNGDAVVTKFNSLGQNLWVSQANSIGDDLAQEISVNNNNRIFITGQFSGTILFDSISLVASNSNGDPFIVEYDTSGVVHWAISATGANGAYGEAICSDKYDNCYAAGNFSGTYSFGTINLTVGSLFITKISSLTSLNISSPVCAGSQVSVPYNSTSTFNAGNIFTAQLSDVNGSFSSPVNIGTFSSTSLSGIITATIPVLTPSGNNYRIRVRSSNPVETGTWQNSFTVKAAPATPQICMVTVDSLSQYNNIFWDKTAYTGVDSFYIYRDTANNNYACIGKVPFASLSQFVDTVRTLYAANGDPNASSWRYKIAIKDSCGIMGNMSPYHQTIFFQHNSGNFNWSPYQIEGQPTPVPSLSNYLFKRDDISSGIWNTIQTLSASSVLYTDANYSTYQATGSWRVETQWSVVCNPTLKLTPEAMAAVSKSRSNVQNNLAAMGINAIIEKDFVLMPNPANDFIVIQSKFPMKNIVVEVYDLTGRLVIPSSIIPTLQHSTNINTSGLSNGIYSVRIISENGKVTKKLVIEK